MKVHGTRHDSNEVLQIVDRAEPPCKSMDPLGGQGDGFVYHIQERKNVAIKTEDRTSSFDEGADGLYGRCHQAMECDSKKRGTFENGCPLTSNRCYGAMEAET